MRIAFIADGRTEHVHRWMSYFMNQGDEVILISSHPVKSHLSNIEVFSLPGLFRSGNAFVKNPRSLAKAQGSRFSNLIINYDLDKYIRPLWQQINVFDVLIQGFAAKRISRQFQPDIVHAMRTQNEGYIAALAAYHPWILSVWGQDFVYYSRQYRIHDWLSKMIMPLPDALTADCDRDIRLAKAYGLQENSHTCMFPGNGGVNLEIYHQGLPQDQRQELIVYPRGIAPYHQIDTILSAMKIIENRGFLANKRLVLLTSTATITQLESMVADYSIPKENVAVLPFLEQAELANLFRQAVVMISASISDGTPNSMLEAMACGAFPVIGDIESIREWIVHGKNGLLFDPKNPQELAENLIEAFSNQTLLRKAQEYNYQIVENKADYEGIMPKVRIFYNKVIAQN